MRQLALVALGVGLVLPSGAPCADGLAPSEVGRQPRGTVLLLDPARREVVAAWAVPAPARPAGLAVRGRELWLAGADGRVVVVDRP